jgi:hypothetical protein
MKMITLIVTILVSINIFASHRLDGYWTSEVPSGRDEVNLKSDNRGNTLDNYSFRKYHRAGPEEITRILGRIYE